MTGLLSPRLFLLTKMIGIVTVLTPPQARALDVDGMTINGRTTPLGIGADGLKTGHTIEAGYGLVGSAKQGDRRIIFAITGLPSDQARAEEAERIIGWAFRQFSEKTVAKAGLRVAEAEVHLGAADTVGLVPAEDVRLLLPALVQDGLSAEVIYNGPLIAPVVKGTEVAEMIIQAPGLPDRRLPLVAEADVAKAGFVKRLTWAAEALYARYLGATAS